MIEQPHSEPLRMSAAANAVSSTATTARHDWRRKRRIGIVAFVVALLAIGALLFLDAKRRDTRRALLLVQIADAGGNASHVPPLADRLWKWWQTGRFRPWQSTTMLQSPKFTNEWIREHDYLRGLDITTLECHSLTGDDLARLIDSHPLEFLVMNRCALSGEVVDAISDKDRLRWLFFENANLSDDDMAQLPLEALEKFGTNLCPVADRGLQQLSRCQRLTQVNLDGNQLTEATARSSDGIGSGLGSLDQVGPPPVGEGSDP